MSLGSYTMMYLNNKYIYRYCTLLNALNRNKYTDIIVEVRYYH